MSHMKVDKLLTVMLYGFMAVVTRAANEPKEFLQIRPIIIIIILLVIRKNTLRKITTTI